MRRIPARAFGLALLLACSGASAQTGGVVFLDEDGDGTRAAHELPLHGVRVSDGREIVVTDADGRYALTGAGDDDLVFVTCPDDFACADWHRAGGGDFALRRAPSEEEFFFVQLSDAHVYDRVSDFRSFSLPGFPAWMPDWASAQVLLFGIGRFYYEYSRGEIVEAFRRATQPHRDVSDAFSSGVLTAYLAEFEAPDGGFAKPADAFRAAVAEIAALRPAFVINTGDLVLDANNATPEAAARWLSFYGEVMEQSGLVVYDTIGNNEIAGISSGRFPKQDPGFGRGLYRRLRGPSHYSFDRGPFHFAAIDTHWQTQTDDGQDGWLFNRMSPEVRQWLDRDLALHADRVLVALNHEPFHGEPEWSFYEPADDEGLFEKHAVAWSLAGHIHRNGGAEIGTTTHVTTAALSGMRWVVPTELHARGYRLFYAHGRRLYSAWKVLGQPLLGFVEPTGDPALHAAAKPRAGEDGFLDVVAVGADASGPFASLELRLDGEPVALERWGEYFVHARIAAPAAGATSRLELRARGAGGATHAAELVIP